MPRQIAVVPGEITSPQRAAGMVCHPFGPDGAGPDGPSLSVSFLTGSDRGLEQEQEDALMAILGDPTLGEMFGEFFASAYPGLTGSSVSLPGYGLVGAGNVPEPSTVAILLLAGLLMLGRRARRLV